LKIVIFESHIIVNVSLTLTNSTIWFVAALCLIVDVRTDVRTYIRTYVRTDGRTFLPGLLGHLGGDDLKGDADMFDVIFGIYTGVFSSCSINSTKLNAGGLHVEN